eukprot:CAMPEP_0113662100 /NCGR_PEP_ID=MMETSP0038_2-20120614/375_1 /TAXON_ID=2898 /ORGANISM="Cryptomonas paramecium" /LENGTH=136 /DNA_ID=CAMNT_0000576931 /DNA_START=127 /DNA_END=537 /DNA_ORIENTATION=+ /assembly_acc=CAM_ASM_000170
MVHADTHKFLASEAKHWGKIWKPLFDQVWKTASVDSATADMLDLLLLDDGSSSYQILMKNIGYSEIICALFLLLNTSASFGALFLAAIMAGATYTHIAMKDDKALIPGVLGALCLLVFILPSRSTPKKASDKPKKN